MKLTVVEAKSMGTKGFHTRIAEEVPGARINFCHIIAEPDAEVCAGLMLDHTALAVVSLSPGELAVVASDFFAKNAAVNVESIDRYLGTVLITGPLADLESGCRSLLQMFCDRMKMENVSVTRS